MQKESRGGTLGCVRMTGHWRAGAVRAFGPDPLAPSTGPGTSLHSLAQISVRRSSPRPTPAFPQPLRKEGVLAQTRGSGKARCSGETSQARVTSTVAPLDVVLMLFAVS